MMEGYPSPESLQGLLRKRKNSLLPHSEKTLVAVKNLQLVSVT